MLRQAAPRVFNRRLAAKAGSVDDPERGVWPTSSCRRRTHRLGEPRVSPRARWASSSTPRPAGSMNVTSVDHDVVDRRVGQRSRQISRHDGIDVTADGDGRRRETHGEEARESWEVTGRAVFISIGGLHHDPRSGSRPHPWGGDVPGMAATAQDPVGWPSWMTRNWCSTRSPKARPPTDTSTSWWPTPHAGRVWPSTRGGSRAACAETALRRGAAGYLSKTLTGRRPRRRPRTHPRWRGRRQLPAPLSEGPSAWTGRVERKVSRHARPRSWRSSHRARRTTRSAG